MTMENHALIFGASGTQGWAIVNELLHSYPTLETFSRVTALTHRPLPDNNLSGINLLENNVEQDLEEKVRAIGTVTHVFFTAYIHHEDPQQEISINVRTLRNAITAVEKLSNNLKSVVLATGVEAYGVHLMKDFPYRDRLPLSEDLPRIPKPWCSQLFYYFQTDFLAERSRGKAWTYCELRPDTIIGFVPNKNAFCLPQTLARFLALYREMNGEGAECPFPGSEGASRCMANDSGQDSIARFAIHAALHPQVCGGGQAFNIVSHSVPASWVEKWPKVCEFFGLMGTPPIPEGVPN
ncbi:putative NAD(P)-binding domain superfamily [Septoria linicola]|nr:putative NAD(P)-binding domain superfamily [Septoria linicola]